MGLRTVWITVPLSHRPIEKIEKIGQKIVPGGKNTLSFEPNWEKLPYNFKMSEIFLRSCATDIHVSKVTIYRNTAGYNTMDQRTVHKKSWMKISF